MEYPNSLAGTQPRAVRHGRFWTWGLLALLCVGSPAHAQPALSLELTLREAVQNHPAVKAGRNAVDAATYDLDGAKWGRFPSLSTEVQSRQEGRQTVARIEQPLWTGGRITGQIDAAMARKDVAQEDLARTEQEVLLQTVAAFYEVLRTAERLKIAQLNEREHGYLLEAIQRRVASEISPQTDQTQAAARRNQAINERLTAERQLAAARSNLEQLLGRPAPSLVSPATINLKGLNEAALLQAALAYSPQRKRLLAQVLSADADIELARAQLMPRLVVGYQSQLTSIEGQQNDGRVYFALQVQTGAGLSGLTAVDAAIARKQAAIDGIESHDRQLAQLVQNTWAEQAALSQQREPVRNLRADSENLVESYIRQFQVGRKTWLDVLNAQREKAQAEYSLADIEAPLLSARVRLLALAGELTIATLGRLYE